MEDAFTIGARLKQEALEARDNNEAEWYKLRSQAYLRDNGVCWVCHKFIELIDYDCGHLIDRCMGGQDVIDNLAPMHKTCNLSKPKHQTLEDAVRWQLNQQNNQLPMSMFDESKSVSRPIFKERYNRVPKQQLSLITPQNNINTEESNISKSNPILQSSPDIKDNNSPVQIEAIKLLSQILNMKPQDINLPISNDEWLKPSYSQKNRPKIDYDKTPRKLTESELSKEAQKYQEQIQKIKPGTICWMQGKPTYIGFNKAPMWRILPPPYTKEVAFIMRRNPPNVIDTGATTIYETMQIIGGELEKDIDINFELGCAFYHIFSVNKILNVKSKSNIVANNGDPNLTIGFGRNQIPVDEWKEAKSKGIPLSKFKEMYKAANFS